MKKKIYKAQKQAKFLYINSKNWSIAKEKGEDDYMARTMIHEFSHAALYIEDYAYGKILAGVDLIPLYALPKGMLAKEDQLDAYKNVMTPSG
ncbi:hypothetical protein [Arsenophonus endosymbiont of Aleurodicus floccissimus]|uniref:hypothetical protein n=1 Tax=Arsenophonus endosymbiont of Aleurodicus floccissimus TaxID=2152761 RepID=UPI000E6B3A89|nr:hypothetical protein [Arsenophonus endosymbiont of Aleurodicus floccissimus]